jgi:uncharacterized membrane protein YhaH (DUF805 family)
MFKAYKRYADFKGRAGRKEFWLFILWMLIGSAVALCLDIALFGFQDEPGEGFSPFYWVFGLANLVPCLAVTFRRLHDIGRTAWWILLGLLPIIGTIVLIVFYAKRGDEGPNAFGPPDGEAAAGPEPIVA